MNFFSELQHDYEDKASKWLVNFQGPNFDIPEDSGEKGKATAEVVDAMHSGHGEHVVDFFHQFGLKFAKFFCLCTHRLYTT